MSDSQDLKSILETDLQKARKANQTSMIVSGIIVVLISGYLLFVNSIIKQFLDVQQLSDALEGIAIDNIGGASMAVQQMIVEQAPSLVEVASDQLITQLIPKYRQELEIQFEPSIDEVSQQIAIVAVTSLNKSKASNPDANAAEAKTETARIMKEEIQGVFKKTLSEKDADGNSPQDSINRSLIHLKSMQENLDKIADGKGDPKKTDAILTLFQVIGQ